jgi:hypothetical protein
MTVVTANFSASRPRPDRPALMGEAADVKKRPADLPGLVREQKCAGRRDIGREIVAAGNRRAVFMKPGL